MLPHSTNDTTASTSKDGNEASSVRFSEPMQRNTDHQAPERHMERIREMGIRDTMANSGYTYRRKPVQPAYDSVDHGASPSNASSSRFSSGQTNETRFHYVHLPLPSENVQKALYGCARGEFAPIWYKFKRFETLALLNLYHYQHELVQLEDRIKKSREAKDGVVRPAGFLDESERETLRRLLHDYHDSIRLFKEISQITRPAMEERQETVDTLSEKLEERHYRDAADALGLLDLTPQALGVQPDAIRVLLAKTFNMGGNGRAHTNAPFCSRTEAPELPSYNASPYEDRVPGVVKPSKGRPYVILISSKIDSFARLLMAVMAGVFLLVPMVTLSYVSSQKYRLIATCLFVLTFAVTVSLASKASNQEVMVASAGYAAVLVVFVGQTISLQPSQ